jgi:predicted nuclease of predicted toxin-antitoxin system
MKLLFDHNLSPRLVLILADLYPNSQHVFPLQMDQDDDRLIWEYALQNDYTIVTRDSDYQKVAVKPCAFRPGISGDGISDSSRAT